MLAFWAGIAAAEQRYPAEYDWRYMAVSNLLSPVRNPDGYLWAQGGIVLCGLFCLGWTLIVARGWAPGDLPFGLRVMQAAIVCMTGAAALPAGALGLRKGHEILTLVAFLGLCLGIVHLAFHAVEDALRQFARARRHAALLAAGAVCPILLAALAQAYVFYVLPGMPWVNLSWRARGVPVWYSFAFWEWSSCAVLSVYLAFIALAFARAKLVTCP